MSRRTMVLVLAIALAGCDGGASSDGGVDRDGGVQHGRDGGAHDGGSRDGGSTPRDGGMRIDAGPDVDPLGTVSAEIHVDHLGWRTGDTKVAVLLGHAGETVEIRDAHDGSIAGTYTAGALTTDEDSSDQVALVDFSDVTSPGDYYVYLPGASLRSYRFTISDTAFDAAAMAAAKSYYFQRCNHDKALPYASDPLGRQWVDGSCHASDSAAPAGPGSADHGALDLHGGWHDAGDYQKTLWNRGVSELLFAYEMNAGAWTDGQLAIPESGNGVPDLLDQIAWELDFYVRMQRPDGHFLTSVKGHAATVTSPPSASDELRVYFDSTAPSGGEWSGGGTTITEATGNAVLALAHAAIVFRGVDDAAASRYATAARSGWGWLASASTVSDSERRLRVAAAAAVARMDSSIASARSTADGFAWSTWDGMRGGAATPGENVITIGAWHSLADPMVTASTASAIRDAAADVIVGGAFDEAGPYGGMFGGPGNGWDWSWGSSRSQSEYGANLMMAVHFGILNGHSEDEVIELAERHLHFMLGLNPLDMLYLTNMSAYGGEHSSFHIYHGWFSYTGGDGDHGNAMYDGIPSDVDEPLYPYYPDDDSTSTYGPPPGIVPGGPNYYYSGAYTIPNRDRPSYAYRDFSVGCDWDGSRCRASSWEITEPSQSYQGPFVLLVSFFASR